MCTDTETNLDAVYGMQSLVRQFFGPSCHSRNFRLVDFLWQLWYKTELYVRLQHSSSSSSSKQAHRGPSRSLSARVWQNLENTLLEIISLCHNGCLFVFLCLSVCFYIFILQAGSPCAASSRCTSQTEGALTPRKWIIEIQSVPMQSAKCTCMLSGQHRCE